jgi:hypothetical protein
MQTLHFALGLILFLLGLITGVAIPAVENPRMGLASHLQGMTNGPFLIVLGLLWPHSTLSFRLRFAAPWPFLLDRCPAIVTTVVAGQGEER